MSISQQVFRPWYGVADKIFSLWARPIAQPDDPRTLLTGPGTEICYVLETGGLADTLALNRLCKIHGMPSPFEPLEFCGLKESTRIIVSRPAAGLIFRRKRPWTSKRLRRLVEASITEDVAELLLIPVGIYWGRAPEKENSWLTLFFSEHWEIAGRIRKFIITILQGRNTLLRYSRGLPLNSIVQHESESEVALRKVSRILRVHFRQRRIATVGPDLSHRRTLANAVLSDPKVLAIIEKEARESRAKLERGRNRAHKYANEIAAHISYPTIRVIERFLSWVWNRIYDGIETNNINRLHDVAKKSEVVYVPCHRSHFDYLLLSYIVYQQGLSLPHVAAGLNLNIPIVGAILRRCGAFYLRRSFKGNRLYSAVFSAYLQQILVRGHSIEYFIEGTRSRTGRLLTPKAGMLAMTVESYVNNPRLPVVFVPIYFGYEKLIEGDSFISELVGNKKKKESLFGLTRALKSLRKYFGKVYVNVGEPVELDTLLDSQQVDWREIGLTEGSRPQWLANVVENLGTRIMQEINSAAAVTPISLLSYVLLATPKQSMGENELKVQLGLSQRLLSRFRYSEQVTIPESSAEKIIDHGEKLDVINRTPHPLGNVISMSEENAVLMTYFRNNIQHLFAVPAYIACCFIQGRRLPCSELQRLAKTIYPFMRIELQLKWDEDELDDILRAAVDSLVSEGLLTLENNSIVRPPRGSAPAYQLMMLGQSMVPMLQRFYLVIELLVRNGPGTLSQAKLEGLCQKSAQRLSMIYGLNSPDFFDKVLFQNFIRTLRDRHVVTRNDAGFIEFTDDIMRIGEDARLVLGEEIRHSILSLTFSGPGFDRL
ncbi:MAG: glycerol-3-phosphate 1-O-acyltransferase [Woeseia sp.]|nr:glycerol-3-phosphate 1-O-acyltransferase [Woeseia sp.]|tara:strand:- start:4388 stop:6865 length:2478 start_codon:yes stop_codon:yes gene_type:complete